jgi:hypothetical protein
LAGSLAVDSFIGFCPSKKKGALTARFYGNNGVSPVFFYRPGGVLLRGVLQGSRMRVNAKSNLTIGGVDFGA